MDVRPLRARISLVLGFLALAACAGAADGGDPLCRPVDLPGLQSAWARLQQSLRSLPAGSAPATAVTPLDRIPDARATAAWDDLTRVAAAILSLDPANDDARLETVAPALASGAPMLVTCDGPVRARDRVARTMVATGYSAREIADVLGGRVSKDELDTAYRLRMLGHGSRRAEAYLDAAIAARQAKTDQRRADARSRLLREGPAVSLPAEWGAALARYAALQGIDPSLVRAVVAAESGGASEAVSRAGAVGLMQLMPATARMLDVDPYDPLDNLRGGIAYLADLVKSYGDVRLALVAYNAGPSHASRVARGEALLYGETRRYLDAIARRYPLPR